MENYTFEKAAKTLEEMAKNFHKQCGIEIDETPAGSNSSFCGITPEDIAAVCKTDNGFDIWPLVLLALLPCLWGNGSNADYWRGKYDALKETMEKKPNE